jgi:hypothetical protein
MKSGFFPPPPNPAYGVIASVSTPMIAVNLGYVQAETY